MDRKRQAVLYRDFSVIFATALISWLFLDMISQFLVALFMGAALSVLMFPLYDWLDRLPHVPAPLAAVASILILLIVIVTPGLLILDVVVVQAQELTINALPWIREQLQQIEADGVQLPDWIPFRTELQNAASDIIDRIGAIAQRSATFMVNAASSVTQGAANFFLQFFVTLYAIFFFLQHGAAFTERVIGMSTLSTRNRRLVQERLLRVTRATLRGTLTIAVIQGFAGGIGLWLFGVPGAAFWGAAMGIASLIPVVGTFLVWGPAVAYLAFAGDLGAAIGLGLWSALIVGSIDNLLRPVLVGKDARLPDLLILISTLGGLATYGAMGLFIGPVVAAIFAMAWEIYEQTVAGRARDLPIDK